MHATVSALRELLIAATGKAVEVVRTPVDVDALDGPAIRDARDAVHLWVWRVDEDRLQRPLRTGPAAVPEMPSLKVSCLVLAADLETLDDARAAVWQNPVLGNAGQRIGVRIDPLDTALLLELFRAARVPPLPCLNCVLQATAG